jgi:hypothetical protein
MNKARLIQQIDIIDPDSGGEVNVCIFKHENGGLFGLDSSYIEQVLDDDGDAIITDPFSHTGRSLVFEYVTLEGV